MILERLKLECCEMEPTATAATAAGGAPLPGALERAHGDGAPPCSETREASASIARRAGGCLARRRTTSPAPAPVIRAAARTQKPCAACGQPIGAGRLVAHQGRCPSIKGSGISRATGLSTNGLISSVSTLPKGLRWRAPRTRRATTLRRRDGSKQDWRSEGEGQGGGGSAAAATSLRGRGCCIPDFSVV